MSKEVFFEKSGFIVSKTDIQGRIKYINKAFIDISGFTEDELIGRSHSIIRHEKMPRCIFQYFWDTIRAGKEMFVYVVNKCKNEDYYWVLAYVTPDLDPVTGEIIGYHSVRRVPSPYAIKKIKNIYRQLLEVESRYSSKKEAIEAGMKTFLSILEAEKLEYEPWIFFLEREIS